MSNIEFLNQGLQCECPVAKLARFARRQCTVLRPANEKGGFCAQNVRGQNSGAPTRTHVMARWFVLVFVQATAIVPGSLV
jgi:hypothetical protein